MTVTVPLVMIKVVLGFLASFFAIILWSKSREIAWLIIVGALILQYLGVLFEGFVLVGLVSWDAGVGGVSLLAVLFQGVPYLLFFLAFLVFLLQKHRF